MLLKYPKEMMDNSSCYSYSEEKGYEATEVATEKEKAIVEKFNKIWLKMLREAGEGYDRVILR